MGSGNSAQLTAILAYLLGQWVDVLIWTCCPVGVCCYGESAR
jgi:hypothetical protein